MLLYAGIKCVSVTGDAGGPHGWNMIEIDGIKSYMDSTWNSCYRDPDAYYMMTYEEISQDHTIDSWWLNLVK